MGSSDPKSQHVAPPPPLLPRSLSPQWHPGARLHECDGIIDVDDERTIQLIGDDDGEDGIPQRHCYAVLCGGEDNEGLLLDVRLLRQVRGLQSVRHHVHRYLQVLPSVPHRLCQIWILRPAMQCGWPSWRAAMLGMWMLNIETTTT